MGATAFIVTAIPAAGELVASNNSPIIVLQVLLRAASVWICCMKGYSRSAAASTRLLLAGFPAEGV
jgi:hypothetical protein